MGPLSIWSTTKGRNYEVGMNRIETAIRQTTVLWWPVVNSSPVIKRSYSRFICTFSCPECHRLISEISEETFAHLSAGGLVVLVEPNISTDSEGLGKTVRAAQGHRTKGPSACRLKVLIARHFQLRFDAQPTASEVSW